MMISSSFILIFAIGLCGASVPQENRTAPSASSVATKITPNGIDTETTDLKWLRVLPERQRLNRTQVARANDQELDSLASANWLSYLANSNGPNVDHFKEIPPPPMAMLPDNSQLLSAMSLIPAGKRRFDDNAALASTGQMRGNRFVVPESEIKKFNREFGDQLNQLHANDAMIDEDTLIRSLSTGMQPEITQRRMDFNGSPPMKQPRYQKPVRALPQRRQLTQLGEKNKLPGSRATNTYHSTKNSGAHLERAASRDGEAPDQSADLDEIFKDDDKAEGDEPRKRVDNAASPGAGDSDGADDDDADADETEDVGDSTRLRAGAASEMPSKDQFNKRQGRPSMRGIEDSASSTPSKDDTSADQEDKDGEQTSVSMKKTKKPTQVDVVLQGTKTTESNADDDEASAASQMDKSAADLQTAAGHHHGHSHSHYYQYVEVPKKKAWKFGFKRGNHKHTIAREEKGYKNKFHSSFKWHAKEKCKKHHKCASHGKMTWHYEHHDKKKGHY